MVPQLSKLVDFGSDCTTIARSSRSFAHSVWCMSAGLDPIVPEAVDFLLILVFWPV